MEEIKFDNQDFFTQSIINQLLSIKKVGNGHPTHIPKNLFEQFYLEDNGSLWINIDNVWKEFTPI